MLTEREQDPAHRGIAGEAEPAEPTSSAELTVTTGTVEIVVAGLFMLVAVVVMYDSTRVGAGWSSDGPQAGYFPFYVSLIMFLASTVTLVTHLFKRGSSEASNFVTRSALLLVLKVLAPTIIYVAVTYFIGIYLASALYIGFFMMWLGKYPISRTVPVAIAIPLLLFWLFEIAFLIPLPKGPLETALGF